MKSKTILLSVVIIILAVLTMMKFRTHQTETLTSPGFFPKTTETAPISVPSPSSTPTPKNYNFDSSTDLRKELDSINPQVLDSDFN